MPGPRVIILARDREGRALAQAVEKGGFTTRVLPPGPRGARLDGVKPRPSVVLIDSGAFPDAEAVAATAASWGVDGLQCLVFDRARERAAGGEPDASELLGRLRAAAGLSPGALGGASAAQNAPGIAAGGAPSLARDLALRIDQAVGAAMAELVGAVVSEVAPATSTPAAPEDAAPGETESSGQNGASGEARASRKADSPREEELPESPRERVQALHALARQGDYFQILGVPRDASTGEVRHAHERRRASLSPERVPEDVQRELADLLEEVRLTLDEALAILADEPMRQAYRENLRD